MTDANYAAAKEQYLLKSVFVRRKIRTDGYYSLLQELDGIRDSEGSLIDWSSRASWGISQKAWEIVEKSNIDPLCVFCHPIILNRHPTTLRYYRSVALLPQKDFSALINKDPKPFEEGKREPGSIQKADLDRITQGLNEVISNSIEQSAVISLSEIHGMFFAQAGMSIDGSWRNKIGNEGQLLIWNLIARNLYNQGDIASVSPVNRGGDIETSLLASDELLSNWQNFRALNLTNGSSVAYSSEPDIILRSSSGEMVGAIEVKAGLDPAGALERTGAVLKTFESVLDEYPKAETILITSCETEESRLRINESRAVHFLYLTAELTTSQSQQRKFITRIRKTLHLVD